jgi:hypothetical protein
MRKLSRGLLVVAALLWPVGASADIVCSFTIGNLWVAPNGWVSVQLNKDGDWKSWWICPVSGSTTINDGYSSQVMTSDSCKTIYSLMLTLKASGKPLNLGFHGPADCSSAALPADGTPTLFPSNFGF